MKKELEYFHIEDSYGGNQDWFTDYMMNRGGCGALTACDTCLYLNLHQGKSHLYPLQESLNKDSYMKFGAIMKPYLEPRRGGIDTLDLFMEGFQAYLQDIGDQEMSMTGFSGEESVEAAKKKIEERIEEGFPVPYLNLLHKNPIFKEYEWHWFLLTGYEKTDEQFLVKAVTYGKSEWLDFKNLWDTGHDKKGGIVLYSWKEKK